MCTRAYGRTWLHYCACGFDSAKTAVTTSTYNSPHSATRVPYAMFVRLSPLESLIDETIDCIDLVTKSIQSMMRLSTSHYNGAIFAVCSTQAWIFELFSDLERSIWKNSPLRSAVLAHDDANSGASRSGKTRRGFTELRMLHTSGEAD